MEENKLTLEELRKVGTIIKFPHEKVKYNCCHWKEGAYDTTNLNDRERQSYGIINVCNEEHILIDVLNYGGNIHYRIPISEFYRLNMIKTEPKFTISYCKSNKVAINCKTKEEWVYVDEIAKTELRLKRWDYYKEESCINISNKTYSGIDFYKGRGYEIIDYNTFIEHNKQEKEMNKKIIGYKFVKEEYIKAAVAIEGNQVSGSSHILNREFNENDHKIAIEKWRKAEVLELWFTPIYENEFKAGEWVVITDSGDLKLQGFSLNKPYELRENLTSLVFRVKKDDNNEDNGYSGEYTLNQLKFRLATPEEIAKSKEKVIKVGNFEVVIKDGEIWHKSDKLTLFVKEMMEKLNIFTAQAPRFGGFVAVVDEITFSATGCQKASKLSEWRAVWAEYTKSL